MARDPVLTKDEAIAVLLAYFSTKKEIVLLVLYGSATADLLRDDSDIDVAIALDHPMTGEEKLDLMWEISKITGRESDVADLRTIGGFFLHQVLSKGKLLINHDPNLYAKFVLESIEYINDIHPIVMEAQKRRIMEFINGR